MLPKRITLIRCIVVGVYAILLSSAAASASAAAPLRYSSWTSDEDLFVRMRDGVHLDTDVMLPKGAKWPLPTVLVRTPYDKDRISWPVFGWWYRLFLQHGYALVLQNERGREFSQGNYNHYLEGAATDGYDTVEWIRRQPWSNGRVGAFGCSSSGENQWPMIGSRPPGLDAAIPIASGAAIGDIPGNHTQGEVYRGGIPQIFLWAFWYHDMATSERLVLPPDTTQAERIRLRKTFSLMPKTWFYTINSHQIDVTHPKHDYDPLFMQLPAKDVLRRLGGALTPFDEFINWTPDDAQWNRVPLAKRGFRSSTPTLLVDTWGDFGVGDMTRMFEYLEKQHTPNRYLIVGSGAHCSIIEGGSPGAGSGSANGSDPNYVASYLDRPNGYANLYLSWFGHFLRGDANGITRMPKVQLYVMGKGWMFGRQWPLRRTRFTKYYLSSRKAPGLLPGTTDTIRTLSVRAPRGGEREDTYLYDPADPVPARGGSCCGDKVFVDQRGVEARRDVISYTTPVFRRGIEVVGPVNVVLYVSSSAKDTDFIVKLVDVYPDGKAINLADDGIRVRYRDGFDEARLMKPGKVYRVQLTDMVIGNYFAPGHRIRLDVTSSDFPTYERNLNTGGSNAAGTTWVTAENSVHHSPAYRSYVMLPVIPN